MRATRASIALLPLVTAASTACFSANEPAASAVEQFVCIQEDVGDDFLLQMTGDFSEGNLAELSSGHDEVLAATGFEGGHFSYWRETVDRPPFDPPIELLCEALEFEDEEAARAFVASLPGDAPPSLGWLPGELPQVEEVPGVDPEELPLRLSRRAFRITADDGDARVTIYALYAVSGRYVQAVSIGDRDGRVTLEQGRAIMESLLQRERQSPSP